MMVFTRKMEPGSASYIIKKVKFDLPADMLYVRNFHVIREYEHELENSYKIYVPEEYLNVVESRLNLPINWKLGIFGYVIGVKNHKIKLLTIGFLEDTVYLISNEHIQG